MAQQNPAANIAGQAQKSSKMSMSNPAMMGGALGGCSCLLAFVLIVGGISLTIFGLNNGGGAAGDITATTACGIGVDTLIPGYKMLPVTEGKLGNEGHLSGLTGSHYCGKDSGSCSQVGSGAYPPHTTDQERWYFNAEWGGWINDGQSLDTKAGSAAARTKVKHAKVIVTNPANGKALVASVEEYGPAAWVSARDGIWYGAPSEVRSYLGTASGYTGNPNDKKGLVKVMFAQDQNVKLGPCLAGNNPPAGGGTTPAPQTVP